MAGKSTIEKVIAERNEFYSNKFTPTIQKKYIFHTHYNDALFSSFPDCLLKNPKLDFQIATLKGEIVAKSKHNFIVLYPGGGTEVISRTSMTQINRGVFGWISGSSWYTSFRPTVSQVKHHIAAELFRNMRFSILDQLRGYSLILKRVSDLLIIQGLYNSLLKQIGKGDFKIKP